MYKSKEGILDCSLRSGADKHDVTLYIFFAVHRTGRASRSSRCHLHFVASDHTTKVVDDNRSYKVEEDRRSS